MRRSWPALVCAALGAVCAAGAAQADWKARYSLEMLGQTAGELELEMSSDRQAGDYTLSASMAPRGLARWFIREEVRERSSGRLGDAVEPRHYLFERSGGDEPVTHRFTLGSERIRVTGHEDVESLPAPNKLQDNLSYLERLRRHLAQTPRQPLVLPILDGDKARVYENRFEVEGEETIDTPHGEYATLRVRRTSSRGKYEHWLWCAPALDYLPVRLVRQKRDGGNRGDLRLREYREHDPHAGRPLDEPASTREE